MPLTMENEFIPKAIEIVKDAIKADNSGDFDRALSLYKQSFEYFMTGLKYEKNKARKDTILKRVDGYFKRAEELKKYIDEQKNGGGSAKTDGGKKGGSTATKDKKVRGEERLVPCFCSFPAPPFPNNPPFPQQ